MVDEIEEYEVMMGDDDPSKVLRILWSDIPKEEANG